MRKTIILASVAAFLAPQTLPARSQDAGDTWGFVNARYDSRASASLYAGYGWRRAFAMVGVSHNPRTGYAEQLAGVGAAVRTGAAEHWIALASAQTRGGTLAQLYWLPTIRTGSVTTRANLKWTVPVEKGLAQKLSVSPISMTVPLRRWLAGGMAVETAAAQGALPSIGAGPELRLRLPRAALVATALRDVPGSGSRVRLQFASRF